MTNDQTFARPGLCWTLFSCLLALTVGHALWATSLDGFTLDEPYHVAAGASYVRWGDFRINPEHPPLVKLVAGLAEPASVLHLAPLELANDKYQERIYTQTAVFKDSNPGTVHLRSKAALIALNTLLLAWLTLLLRRVFDWRIALLALLLLALDPTVSAHLPVVMTDLPLALLGAITCCAAMIAVRRQRWLSWVELGTAAGLMLSSKHSAPLIALPVVTGCVIGLFVSKRRAPGDERSRPVRFAGLAIALALSVGVLWASYGFHYRESRDKDSAGRPVETFNRPLDAKIDDLSSPLFRRTLHVAVAGHVLPRAYLWGLADTLRAGVEGRPIWIRAFGHNYQGKAPFWVPFAFLVVKVPLVFLLLSIAGGALLLAGRLPDGTARGLWPLALAGLAYMLFIAKNGVFYAGLRHWLFVVPVMAAVAAAAMAWCLDRPERWLRVLPGAAVLLLAVTVLPQRRIWNYHNLLAGGSSNAWRLFTNESVGLGQRSDEIIAYWRGQIKGDRVLIAYPLLREQREAAGLHEWEPTPEEIGDGHLTTWFVVDAQYLPIDNWKGVEVFRTAKPVTQIGETLVFHGTYYLPIVSAGVLTRQAVRQMQIRSGDLRLAENYLRRAAQLDPESTFIFLELGNFAVDHKNREEAVRCYRKAMENEEDDMDLKSHLSHQLDLLATKPIEEIQPMRDGKE